MADTYGILLSSFFDGTTGMKLQTLGAPGKDALLLASFLTANEWANMIGLYEISLAKVARKLPTLKGRVPTIRAFQLLEDERYAYYDEPSEFVWVREMARVRLNLSPGQASDNNNRLKGARNLYQRLPLNPYLSPFFDRYHIELALPHRRGVTSNDVRTVFETPPNGVRKASERRSNGVRTVSEVCLVPPQTPLPVPVHQVPEIRDQGSGTSDQVPEKIKAAAAPPIAARPVENPADNVEVITALVRKEVLPLGLPDEDAVEATKHLCARQHIAYDSVTVRKAIDSARFRGRLVMAKASQGRV